MSSDKMEMELPWPKESGVWQTYDLHCHCGAVRYNMSVSPPLLADQVPADTEDKSVYTVVDCKCSHCERNGAIAIHPLTSKVKFTRGEDNLKEYRFGNKVIPHFMCKDCGNFVYSDLKALTDMVGQEQRYMLNLRMLKDVPLSKLTIQQSETMKNMPPHYEIGP